MTLDKDRRAELTTKYGLDRSPMDPGDNSAVQTMLAAERLEARAFARGTEYNQWLFDPARSPTMHGIAAGAHRDLRRAIARGDIECDDPNDDRILVHFVGSARAVSVERGLSADRFARKLREHDATQPYCDDYTCNIQIAPRCAEARGQDCAGGSTMLLPLLHGGVLLIFECCGACHAQVRDTATTNTTAGFMGAHVDLRPGDVVLPDHTGQGGFVVPDLTPAAPTGPSLWERIRSWIAG